MAAGDGVGQGERDGGGGGGAGCGVVVVGQVEGMRGERGWWWEVIVTWRAFCVGGIVAE